MCVHTRTQRYTGIQNNYFRFYIVTYKQYDTLGIEHKGFFDLNTTCSLRRVSKWREAGAKRAAKGTFAIMQG
jgi:hypothetical protein